MNKRDIHLDMLKGILIILVVAGHFAADTAHDIIFLFHMPLFFIISGYLLRREKITDKRYTINKIATLFIPYAVYLMADFLLVRRTYSIRSLLGALWGGRYLSGTYWYMTCFVFTLILFSFLLKRNWSDKKTVVLILVGGGMAVIESHLAEYIELLGSPGIPWNLDVALLALVYIAIGYYGKAHIKKWLSSGERKYDMAALAVAFALAVFCILNVRYEFYYFDMKPLYYKELFSAIIIPCAFGVVIVRVVCWMDKAKVLSWLNKGLAFLGRITIPIMFIHVPLNTLLGEYFEYGRLLYCMIGIGVPVAITIAFSRFKVMRRLLGLPKLMLR